jgi:hypothetical protein
MKKELATHVWQMSGFIKSYTAGVLILNDGMVSFLTEKGEQFKVPLSEVKNIKWPILQMGYGVHFDVNGKTYKFTFVQPPGENSFDPGMISDIGRIATGIESINTLAHLKDYKVHANEWKEVLKN